MSVYCSACGFIFNTLTYFDGCSICDRCYDEYVREGSSSSIRHFCIKKYRSKYQKTKVRLM